MIYLHLVELYARPFAGLGGGPPLWATVIVVAVEEAAAAAAAAAVLARGSFFPKRSVNTARALQKASFAPE